MLEEQFQLLFPEHPIPKDALIKRRSGVIEDFENIECGRMFLSKSWKQVSRNELADKGQFCPKYLTKKALAYYLPAMFLAVLENKHSDLANTLEFLFCDEADFIKSCVKDFAKEQRQLLFFAFHQMMEDSYEDEIHTDSEIAGQLQMVRAYLS